MHNAEISVCPHRLRTKLYAKHIIATTVDNNWARFTYHWTIKKLSVTNRYRIIRLQVVRRVRSTIWIFENSSGNALRSRPSRKSTTRDQKPANMSEFVGGQFGQLE